jgi:hypothetical protein
MSTPLSWWMTKYWPSTVQFAAACAVGDASNPPVLRATAAASSAQLLTIFPTNMALSYVSPPMLGQTLRIPIGRRNQAFPYVLGNPRGADHLVISLLS